MEIRLYTPDFETMVKAFNLRLRAGGEQHWSLPESYVPRFPKLPDKSPYQQFFLTCDRGQVRGGYLLTQSRVAIRDEIVFVACGPQLNVSEGLINPVYRMIGVVQVRDLLQRHPLSYSLGPGRVREGMPKLLVAMGWTLIPVPLRARIVSTSNFLAEVKYLRHHRAVSVGLDLLRRSRIGKTVVSMAQGRVGVWPRISVEQVSQFGNWADTIWNRCRNRYSFIAVRDSETLNTLYPPKDHRFIRLKISCSADILGWVVLLAPKLSSHRYFGDMQVGSIVDCLAVPENASVVVACASRFLEDLGVDLIVSSQTSDAWNKALSAAGFLRGPSNFLLALSPALTKKLEPLQNTKTDIHMNRGDGEGPTIL